MSVCLDVQSAKPPWNQPQLTFFALSRSPTLTFLESVEVDVSRESHTSPVGCGSPMTDPFVVTADDVCAKPCVWPDTRLSAPGVDGPNVVLYELSLIAKCCA